MANLRTEGSITPSRNGELHQRLEQLGVPLRLLEEVFLQAPVGMQVCDMQGRCVLANPTHTRLFGAARTGGYNLLEDARFAQAGLGECVRRAFAGERITLPTLWYDARDTAAPQDDDHGGRFPVSTELVPLRAPDGHVTHVLLVSSDMTETQRARERAEEAAHRSAFLAEAGRLLASTLDFTQTLSRLARLATPTLADFCIVDMVGADGRVRRVAAAHADALAQPIMDELMNHPPVPGSRQPARRVLESGRPELLRKVDPDPSDTQGSGPAYQALAQRLGVRSCLTVPMVSGSRTVGVISLGYVLDRRYSQADVALAEALASRAAVAIDNARLYDDVTRSEERFRLMADSVPQIVWITDAGGNVEFFNRQWTLYTGQDSPKTTADAARMLHPDDVALSRARFEEAVRTGGQLLIEHRIRSASGEYRWFLVRGVPQRDAHSGQVVRWFGASVDIHDLKMAESALRESDRRKDEFLATLAHELRNPLAAIRNAWWLMRSKAAGPGMEGSLNILGRQIKRLSGLVDDLLDVSRVTHGLITLRHEQVDLNSIVARALESVQGLMDEYRHEVAVTHPARPIPVMGDAARLEQIMVNLMANAAKYTDPHGHISVTLGTCDGQAEVVIQDNGVGISPQFLAHIFELFTQAERGLARAKGGLGVGLTIAKRLVELHGGSVSVSSPGLGQGATFRVRLPLAPAGAPTQQVLSRV